MTLRVPVGPIYDPVGMEGAAAVGVEWWLRGAGDRDTRQLNDALDSLGCRHSEAAAAYFITFAAAQVHQRLPEVLALYRDIMLAPRLADDGFEPSRDLVANDLLSLDDHPAQKANVLIRERFFPAPLGCYHLGRPEALASMTAESVRDHVLGSLAPAGSILAVAGKIHWDELVDLAEKHFADWPSRPAPAVATTPPAGGVEHIAKDTAQTHIALAQASVTLESEHYYPSRVAVCVLSGGMSGRLMTEVREKRGLVYRVGTSYRSLKSHAGWFTYAGTVPEKAQETLDVTVGELRRMSEGISEAELTRAKTQLKSDTIMGLDLSGTRSAWMDSDWHHLGRVRTIEEITQAIDAVTVDDVLAYLNAFPAKDFVGVVIGPEPIDTGILEA